MPRVTGEGSIVALEQPERSCKRWRLQVPVGRNPLTGKYEKRRKVVRGTKTEARAALREFIAEVEGGYLDAENVTLGEFAQLWLREREQGGNVRAGTLRNNRNAVSHILHNEISRVRLRDLNAAQVSAYYIALREGNIPSGRKLTGTTARKDHITLKQILTSAVRRRIIQFNPCEELGSDAIPKNDTKEKHPLTDKALFSLIGKLYAGEPDAHRVGACLAVECGLRREEVVGLTWRGVKPARAHRARLTGLQRGR